LDRPIARRDRAYGRGKSQGLGATKNGTSSPATQLPIRASILSAGNKWAWCSPAAQ
jgi:hypothetical protein